MATAREPLLSIEDLSRELGVPVPTIYQWRSRGGGPPGMRIGRHVRFRREDIDRWLEQQRDPRPAA